MFYLLHKIPDGDQQNTFPFVRWMKKQTIEILYNQVYDGLNLEDYGYTHVRIYMA